MNRELDAQVAVEVMGWTVNRSESGWCTMGVRPKRLIGPALCRLRGDIWSPSTSIADAWLVVEKLIETERFHLDALGFDGEEWRCVVLEEPDDEKQSWHIAEAPTAPEAICLAALEAVA